jgi:hypothetical protein
MQGKADRIVAANNLIVAISSVGRHFFLSKKTGNVARFVLNKNGRLYYVDGHNGIALPLVHTNSKAWRRHFSQGGTLKGLVLSLAEFIRCGKQVGRSHFFYPDWYSDGDPWGYDDAMKTVQASALQLGVISDKPKEEVQSGR